MARLFAAGRESVVREALAKLIAIRTYNRARTVGDVDLARAEMLLLEAACSPAEAEEIYQLTALPTFPERLAVPPYQRELPIEETVDPFAHRGEVGLGRRSGPRRRF